MALNLLGWVMWKVLYSGAEAHPLPAAAAGSRTQVPWLLTVSGSGSTAVINFSPNIDHALWLLLLLLWGMCCL